MGQSTGAARCVGCSCPSSAPPFIRGDPSLCFLPSALNEREGCTCTRLYVHGRARSSLSRGRPGAWARVCGASAMGWVTCTLCTCVCVRWCTCVCVSSLQQLKQPAPRTRRRVREHSQRRRSREVTWHPDTFFHPGTSKRVCWCWSPFPSPSVYVCSFTALILETHCLRRQ